MKKSIINSEIFKVMEEWAPKDFAYDWDNVGLQMGSFNKSVKKIMITLDVLESVADEAIEKEVDLIIAHHPLLFKPVKRLNTDQSKGRTIQKLLQHHISVYASHTNLDIATGGINDILCDYLGIQNRKILIKTHSEKLFKVIVYVPNTHIENVREALSNAGAGHIGDYSHCTFQSEGQGTFKPLEGTNPHIGIQNKLEYVNEHKIETIVQERKLNDVLDAAIQAHPYEEVAYDVYPVNNEGQAYGIGRIGSLNKEMTLQSLAEKVKKDFNIPHVRVTGDLTKKINKAAILGGSGEKYIYQAKQMGADVYITGDMTFHNAQDAWEMGLSVIDAGHYIEKVMKQATKQYLDQKLPNENLEIIVSETKTEPFQFI
ncbi:Nif3-like dinuclear metal center hexameric protein [Virgibacillus alimentarius]|uniref:GTP cyclohydrolase 1 type 2 homolog n=1 Tax=Virgibacillus alimentarius TaxID=698769 RepID=A0ABS4S4V9_9BACI|nr:MULTISPECIES: Nif3-like dinuclear metal center hexameric protein [Virgibacillus]MBP2256528.1 dinuclear metal center YbgI/SA1388 family protein [Virgibacillus alimentarius]HLR66474.1 Nif3-like dinuclear metal center hexameric protein [Virgibacillus sp.]